MNASLNETYSVHEAVEKYKKLYGKAPNISLEQFVNEWDVVCTYYMRLYTLCETFHCLPATGGLEDQDWLVVEFFGVIQECIAEHYSREMKKHGR